MLQTQRFQDSCPFLDGHTDVLISRGSYWLKISGEFWYEFFIVGIHSRIRVYVEHAIRKVKTWRIMGDRYRNPLKKYDRINDVVCGLVNQRLLWLAERAA